MLWGNLKVPIWEPVDSSAVGFAAVFDAGDLDGALVRIRKTNPILDRRADLGYARLAAQAAGVNSAIR